MSKFKYNLAVIGLGYVGLPLAIEAANSKLKVAGYDINESVVDSLNKSMSHVEDISDKVLQDALSKDLIITSDSSVLGESEFIVISVPTPLTDYQPDLSYVEAATKSIAENLKKGQIIILESTTYPGTTLEIVKPILEKNSNLVAGEDFLLGYSPERIDPGNKEWTFKNTPKIVSGINEKSLKKISEFYNSIIDEVVEVSGTREAEMVKLIENTYRQVNIAMVNELAILSNMLDIDIWEVVEADDGGIVAVGSKLEDREFYFYDHFWFLKVDADGNQVWSREIGTNDRYDMAFDVIKMPDGGFAATGMSTINSNGVAAMRVVRISANGAVMWNKKAGGDGYQDMGHALALNQNENVLMVAGTKQPYGDDSHIKLWGYNPDTGNRLFTINNIDREFGLGSWGVVASYDNGFIITSNPSLIKMDSLGNFQYAQ